MDLSYRLLEYIIEEKIKLQLIILGQEGNKISFSFNVICYNDSYWYVNDISRAPIRDGQTDGLKCRVRL